MARTVEVSGQIDRLIVDGNEVVIVDYKTNLKPPETLRSSAVGISGAAQCLQGVAAADLSGKDSPMPIALDNRAIVDGDSGRTS